MKVHFTHNYLLNPTHPVTVDVIGIGGTGSQVLSNMARLNATLIALGHPGIYLTAWDDDIVTDANIGRQLFSPADLGQNKAMVLIHRINSFYGFGWVAAPNRYESPDRLSNITISCVDTAAGRIDISKALRPNRKSMTRETDVPMYWLDLGNLQKTGQVILGTVGKIKQPKSEHTTTSQLKNVVEYFPGIRKINEKDQGPSCSLAEALTKQDLFINSILAQLGVNMIWKLFREGMITVHGCYVNLKTLTVNPIKL